MFTYRIATMEDYYEIIIMKNAVKQKVIDENLPIWQNGYPTDEIIKEDIENGYGRIIVINNKIVSYATFHPALYEYDPGTFPIDELMSFGRVMTKVTETNKGYAYKLIENIIEETKQKGYKGLGILVDDFNKKALNLYLKFDFKYCGTGIFPWAVLDKYYLIFEDE